jgi:GAF domain-containing protein
MSEKHNTITYPLDAQRQARLEMREAIWRMQGSQDLVQVLECMYHQLRSLEIPFHYCSINMVEETTPLPRIAAYTMNRAGELHERVVEGDASANILRFWQDESVVYRRDLEREDLYKESAYMKRLARSIVDLPFIYGTMTVSSPEAEAFSSADLDILGDMTRILSEGIQRMRDLQDLESQIRRTDALAAAIAVVTGTHRLDEVFQTVVNQVARLLDAERTSIFLFDKDENALIPQAQVGFDWETFQQLRLQPGESMSGHVFATGKPYMAHSGYDAIQKEMHAATRKLYEGALEPQQRRWGGGAAVPLRLNNQVIGTLSVSGSQRPFVDDDVKFLGLMADQAALAIDRVQRTEDLQKRNAELEEKERFLHALQEIGETTLSSLDLDEILDNLAFNIVNAGIFETLMIALVDHQLHQVEVVRNHRYRMVDGRPVPDQHYSSEIGLKYDLDDNNITAEVARTGAMRVIEEWDERFDTHFDTPRARQGRASYFIPVKQENRVLVILATGSKLDTKRNS